MKKTFKNLGYIIIYLLTITSIYSQPITVNLIWEKVANVGSMEFTSNGQHLITGGGTNSCYPYTCGQIKIWRVADSTLLNTITNFQIGYTNDISIANSNQIFVTGNGSVYCAPKGGCSADRPGQFKWNFPDGALQASLLNPGGIVQSIDYSPDNTLIATGTAFNNTGEIRIYDPQFNLIRILTGHDLETSSVEFTPDGQKLISGGHDGKVKIWNVSDGSLIRTLDHGTYTNGGWDVQVDISPDGQLIASAGKGYNMTVKIWRISDGQLLHTLPVVTGTYGYNSIQFSPNGIYIASGITSYGLGGLGWHGTLKFWRVSDGALVREYIDTIGSPSGGGVRTIAFSPSGNNFFAYSIYNRLRLATTDLNLVTITSTGSIGSNNHDKFFLHQNFPNPFNPTTKIKFDIPNDAGLQTKDVRLVIYNTSGEVISTLVNRRLSPGNYEVEFNGSNLSSGIYFYKLEVGNVSTGSVKVHSEVKRMILIK